MKREARILLTKSTDSVLLAIEHFNRPWDRGRHEAVLIFLDRSFELLLKSVIINKGGKIRKPRAKETLGFESCVRKCLTEGIFKSLTEEDVLTIQIINSLRDAVQHYILEVSEQQLYIYTQSGLTLFDKILRENFNQKLINYLPERVLPVSTSPPKDFSSLMDIEFDDIKNLIKPKSRKKFQAQTKLLSFAIIEASLGGNRLQPGENDLKKLVNRISKGESWKEIFPGIKQLTIDREGRGLYDPDCLNLMLRISKTSGEPVHLVPEGTPGATIVAIKRVDELGFYSLNVTALSQKVKLSVPKTLAVIKELKIQGNPEYFKEISIGANKFKQYSPKALNYLKNELPKINLEEIWNKHKNCNRKNKNTYET